jgi:hypothetical protein
VISPARSWVGIETVSREGYQTGLDFLFVSFLSEDRSIRSHIVTVFLVPFLADCDTDIRGSAQFNFL